MHRLLLLVLSLALLWVASASAATAIVLEITDTDPVSAHELAQKLRDSYSRLGLDITQVDVLEQHTDDGGQKPAPAPAPENRGQAHRSILHRRLVMAGAWALTLLGLAVALGLLLYTLQRVRTLGTTRATSVLCILLLLAPTPSLTLHRAYTNCKVLNPALDYRLYWNNVHASTGVLQLAMEAEAQGWIAFGVSTSSTPGSLMDSAGSGSDMAIGYIGGDCADRGCVFDYWSTEHEMPEKDATQNVSLVHAARTDRTIAIEFDRPLTTRGPLLDQDVSIPPKGDVMVIYAVNPRDTPSGLGARLSYHGPNRGGMLVDFSQPSSCERVYRNERVRISVSTPFSSFDPATFIGRLASALKVGGERFVFVTADDPQFACTDCETDEFRFPNVSITPAMGQTNYLCVNYQFPVDRTYHAVRFDPIINAASSPVVHHMILFSLSAPSSHPANEMYSCEEMPNGAAPLFVWAVGASSFMPPDEVGFRVGQDAVQYATLQIHFNNPSLGSWIDSSGVRVYRTPTLRPHNAAWAVLGGFLDEIALPPGIAYPSDQLVVKGNCPAKVVDHWTAWGDVHVFAYVLHAHLLGRKILTQQWRNGAMVSEMSNDPYSFNYQHAVIGDWTIKKGDSLNTTCWYDSTSRTDVTRGGLASTDEMCFAILAFWCPDPCPLKWAGGGCFDFADGYSPSSSSSADASSDADSAKQANGPHL